MSDLAPAPKPARGLGFWGFIGLMLVLMALFIGLGIWQLQRLAWKEGLIAEVAARADLPPVPLPPAGEWPAFDMEAANYRPFTVTGHWVPEATAFVFTSLPTPRGGPYGGVGYWVMTPLALTGGGTVLVDRGFIPDTSLAAFRGGGPLPQGEVTLAGIARAPEETGPFTPGPDAADREDFIRDPARLAPMLDPALAPVAPIYIDLPKGPPGALPQGGETEMEFPNNHLGYAFTWFGFAILIPPLLWLWVRRQRRPRAENLPA
jgi:surfeit locus 1 family protein